jgi:hypothetical protein
VVYRDKHAKSQILIDLRLLQTANDGRASFSLWQVQMMKPSNPRGVNTEYTEQEPRVQGPSDVRLVMHHERRGLWPIDVAIVRPRDAI